jgi:hypothetical protein
LIKLDEMLKDTSTDALRSTAIKLFDILFYDEIRKGLEG